MIKGFFSLVAFGTGNTCKTISSVGKKTVGELLGSFQIYSFSTTQVRMPPKKNQKQMSEQIKDDNSEQVEEKKSNKPIKKQASLKSFGTVTKEENKEQYTLGDGVFSQTQILISSWNVNGVRAVNQKGDLVQYITTTKPDILCLNETKIDHENFLKDKPGKEFPSEYNQYWNFCQPPNKGYSGVAILSLVAPISVQEDIGIEKHDQEGRTLTLEFDKFYLVSCYVPNAGRGLPRLDYRVGEWDVDFQKYLNDLAQQKRVILCGDLNVAHKQIDLANYQNNARTAGFTKEERESFTQFLDGGWVDTFRSLHPTKVKYSYFSAMGGAREQNVGWRLDYFIIDQPGMKAVGESEIQDKIVGSDHVPIELTLNVGTL